LKVLKNNSYFLVLNIFANLETKSQKHSTMPLSMRFIISTVSVIFLIILLNSRIGQLPPPGKFLDPIKGIWQNALIPDIPESADIYLEGLQSEVKIVFNKRGVPHIFASNNYDLYFASGYVMAMHRLWQMEFATHASMGRLSEIVGERAIEYDKYIRRLGMVYGAEKMLEQTAFDTESMLALQAYSDGVNAWISNLQPSRYPFEYKLLDYKPEPWSPIKTLALGMSISHTLSSGSRALRMSYQKACWGKEAVIELYTGMPKYSEPIITKGTPWNFDLKPPTPPTESFIPEFIFDDLIDDRDPNVGSNNWALAGSKTLSGHPLFATDPHLGLTLPSIWYEMQLNGPGINAYGVTFAGVPAIIMGFNEHIAWGNTNTGNKVFDIFEIETDENYQNYLHDGKWLPLDFRIENYQIRSGKTITDTIAYTHHGPIMYRLGETSFSSNIPLAHAISWTAHQSGNVIKPLLNINTSKNFPQFKNALSQLNSPPQNYAFAAISGDIAMQLNGLYPLRWEHQGMFISDGRDSRYDWNQYIPFSNLPFEMNPGRGFVSSANQHLTDQNYPYYTGWWFASPARSSVINNTLASLTKATPDDMKKLQLDASNFWAEKYLQRMVDSVSLFLTTDTTNTFNTKTNKAVDSLLLWDMINHPTSTEATLFEEWRKEMVSMLWQQFLDPMKQFRPLRPSIDVSFRVLFHEPPVKTYRDIHQALPQTSLLLTQSLSNVLDRLERDRGEWGENWQWWRLNGSTINHLLNIPALNEPRIQVGGSNESPNAISGNHGPSWRMVAELSDPISAWGIYPGGQAANPATKGYNAFVNDWANGNYYPLQLFHSFDQAAEIYSNIVTLKPERNNQNMN
jgi:penicillin G amidase